MITQEEKKPYVFAKVDHESEYPKIIGIEWRSATKDTIGFVAVQTSEKTWKAYCGVTQSDKTKIHPTQPNVVISRDFNIEFLDILKNTGDVELADAKYIAKYGCKMSESEANCFFPQITDYKLEYIK